MSLDFESRYGDRLPYYTNIDEEICVPEHVRRLLAVSSKSTLPRGLFLAGPDTIKLRDNRFKMRSRPNSDTFSRHFNYAHGYATTAAINSSSSSSISRNSSKHSSSLNNSRGFRNSMLNLNAISEVNNQVIGSGVPYVWESKRIHVRDIPFVQPEVIERPAMITFRKSSSLTDENQQHIASRRNSDYETALKRFNRTSLALGEESDLHRRAQNLLHSSSFAIKRPQLLGTGPLSRDGGFSQSVLNLRDFEKNINDFTNRTITEMTTMTSNATTADFNKFTIPRIPWNEFEGIGEEENLQHGDKIDGDESTT